MLATEVNVNPPPIRGYYRPGESSPPTNNNKEDYLHPPTHSTPTKTSTTYTVPSTGLIRICLSKPMGIVLEPMADPHNPSQQRGVRICELPPEGAAAASQRLEIEDELLSINDKTVSRLTFDQVMDILLEAPADKVDLLFRRPKRTDHKASVLTPPPAAPVAPAAPIVVVQEKKLLTKSPPTTTTATIAAAPLPPRSNPIRRLEDTTEDRYSYNHKSTAGGRRNRISDEDSVLTGDDDDETVDMMDQSTHDESAASYRSIQRRADRDVIHQGRYDSVTFLDHLIDSLCAPILGDAGHGGSSSTTRRSRPTRTKSNTRYYSDDDDDDDDDDEEDLSYKEDGTIYTEESDSKYRGRKKSAPVPPLKKKNVKTPEDDNDDEDSFNRDYPRGKGSKSKGVPPSTSLNNNKQHSKELKSSQKAGTDTTHWNNSRDKYNNKRASSGKDEPQTIHERDNEDDDSPISYRRGKPQDKSTLLQSSSPSEKMMNKPVHNANKDDRKSKSPLPSSRQKSKSPLRHEPPVVVPKKTSTSMEKRLPKSLVIEPDLSMEENIPIKELEYDDNGADVSVMDSVGGPSIILDNPQHRGGRKIQESTKKRLVSADVIVRFGQDYPYDLGFTREEFIQLHPLKFYRFVVCDILKKYEPEKLRLVSKLMEKYNDREEHLIQKLAARYQVDHEGKKQSPKESSEDWDTRNPVKTAEAKNTQPQQRLNKVQEEEPDDGFQTFNAFPSVYFDSDSKGVFGFDPWPTTTVDPPEEDVVPNNVIDNDGYDETNSSYTDSDYESIDGTSPVVIAQVSDLINYVYGKTTVVGQIDRVSTIMKAYEGREAVLLELLETKALIKANSPLDPGSMEDLPSCIRDNPSYHKQQQPQLSGGNLLSPLSNLTISTLSTNNVVDGPSATQKNTSTLVRSPNTPKTPAGKNKSGLFGFLSGKKSSKKGSTTSGGAFPSKEGKKKINRPGGDIILSKSSDCSV